MRRILATKTGKVLLSVAVLGIGASLANLGTFASFTSTTSASQSITAGTVAIGLGTVGPANRLSVNATGVVPGDTIQRAFDLIDSGNQNLASVTLTTTAAPSSLLDTDAVNGLQMSINKCSVAWTEAGVAPAYTYTCSGATTAILASQAVIGAGINMPSLAALTAGATDHLHLTLTLPATAGNTFQGLTDTISYSFLGTQRAGTNQ